MKTGEYSLDTNIIIAILANDPTVIEKIKRLEKTFIPVTVVGELFYGAYNSKKVEKNLAGLFKFLEGAAVLEPTLDTARHYGIIKAHLKSIGKPIPENDIWIAAVSIQYQLTLITRDAHFKEVSGLSLDLLT